MASVEVEVAAGLPAAARRKSPRSPWLVALSSLVLLAACGGTEKGAEPAPVGASGSVADSPPVFLVTIDTLRADRLPAYGYDRISTPHLDRFRADSILFANAYSPCPLTLPAHASLLTGLLPPAHGVRDNVGYTFPAGTPTLQGLLKEGGYATAAAVSAYVLRRQAGLAVGFDSYGDRMASGAAAAMGSVQRPGGETVEEAIAWLQDQDGGTSPPFLFLHLFEPHSPWEPPEPFRSRFGSGYDGEIAAADAYLGRFFDYLREAGLYDDALIVVASDHGEGLGDHGEQEHGILLYREALHVPLLVKLPGHRRAGETVEAPVGLVDVLPTVAEVVGFEAPPDLAGRSLLGPVEAGRRLYSETYYPRIHLGWSEMLSLVGSRFHLIEGTRPELFDLVNDPRETRDVLQEHRRVYREMEAQLDAVEEAFAEPAPAGEEEKAALAALGYLSAPAPQREGPRQDPRDALPALGELTRALALAGEGNYEEAAAALGTLLEDQPGLQDARLQRADVLRILGRFDEAEEELRQVVAGFPGMMGAVALQMAELYLEQERWEEAEAQALQGLTVNPGRARLLLARIALGREDLAAAEDRAREALAESIAPEAAARLVLARVRLRQERFGEALQVLEEARELAAARGEPEPWLHFLRGEALARSGRTEEAAAAFQEEIRRFPRHVAAYAQLAIVLGVQQRFGEIEPLLERMVAAVPDRETYLEASRVLERLGNEAAAERWRQRAEQAPGEPS